MHVPSLVKTGGGLLAAALLLSACTAVVRTPGAQLRVHEPPPLRAETRPAQPGAEMHWVPGHWVWRGAWVWQDGHYVAHAVPPMPAPYVEAIVVAPSPAHIWVRGHWHWGGRGWVWAGGRWVLP